MSEITSIYYVVFDNVLNSNLFDPSNYQNRFDTQEEAFEVAMQWKKATGDSISIKCIRTVESSMLTF